MRSGEDVPVQICVCVGGANNRHRWRERRKRGGGAREEGRGRGGGVGRNGLTDKHWKEEGKRLEPCPSLKKQDAVHMKGLVLNGSRNNSSSRVTGRT